MLQSERERIDDDAASANSRWIEHRRRAQWLAVLFALCGAVAVGLLARDFTSGNGGLVNTHGSDAAAYVQRHPFDAAGYLALASMPATTAADAQGRSRLLRVAELLAPTDPAVLDRVATERLEAGRPDEAMATWKRLIDASPGDRERFFTAFDRVAEQSAWSQFVSGAAQARWPHLGPYALHVCALPDAMAVERASHLLTLLAQTAPAEPSLVHCLERRLLATGQVERAFALRVVFTAGLPRRIDHVFNGDFERAPDGSAFDWVLSTGGEYRDGFVVSLRTHSDGDNPTRHLHVRFTGRPIRGHFVEQVLALRPGTYVMSYRALEVGFGDAQTPRWTLRCSNEASSMLPPPTRATAAAATWLRTTMEFTVPAHCMGQTLRLEPASRLSALEGLRGVLSIDDVAVARRD